MQIFPPLDRLALVLGAAGLLAGSLAVFGVWLETPPPATRPLSPLPALVRGTNATVPQLSAMEGEALRRPPFAPSRRLPQKPISQAGSAADFAPDLTINGIIAGDHVGAVAGLDKRTQKPFSLRAGETMGDWQIDSIDRNGLKLRRGDQVRDYPLQLPPAPPKAQRQP
ncbi:MAG TPA: hypothetical protein VKP60_08400 [Magnetospirillaceae bacterium]|nr:hypothetical protein [Magnetospirillaceae bacterium]